MTGRELDEQILYELWRLYWASSRRVAFRLRALLETPVPQFLVMHAVTSSSYAMGPVDIAEAMGCSRANVGPIVDRLVEIGWVTKTRSPRDARCITVRLTSEGEASYVLMAEEVADAVDGFADELYPEEREALLSLLQRIRMLHLD